MRSLVVRLFIVLTMISFCGYASEMPNVIEDSVKTACKLVSKGDVALNDLCLEVAKTSYEAGYREATVDGEKK